MGGLLNSIKYRYIHSLKYLLIIVSFLINIPLITSSVNQWPIFRGDSQLSGNSSVKIDLPIKLANKYQFQQEIKASPIINEQTIFISTLDGNILALDLNTLEVKWKYQTNMQIEASGLVVQDMLCVGDIQGNFWAFNKRNGQLLWKYSGQEKITGSANYFYQAKQLYLVFGTYGGQIICLNGQTGQKQWVYQIDNYINGTPAIFNNQIAIGGCDALLHVINTQGKLITSFNTGSYIASSPIWENNNLIAANYGGTILSFNVLQNKENWQHNNQAEWDAFFSTPAFNDELIIIGNRNGQVYGFDKKSGKSKWSFLTGKAIDSSAVLTDQYVVIGSQDGYLYMLDIEKGSEVWSFYAGSPILNSVALIDSHLVLVTENGMLYHFTFNL
ncbi:MAG: PQQ-binding-like beta-propeller repeat protein [Spirochaetes bacterium]|nr:PQQ-binding-like beta-propeller repeat protein [Spirochaetota bacterium]